ncbi:uncharacterized protein A4U43_C09F10350, partial [Asparagus officinalis]
MALLYGDPVGGDALSNNLLLKYLVILCCLDLEKLDFGDNLETLLVLYEIL